MKLVRRFSQLALVVIGLSTTLLAPSTADATVRAGQALSDALQELNAGGANIFFSTRVVADEMRVREAPLAADPVAAAREILAPHRLVLVPGPAGRWIVAADDNPQRDAEVTVVGRVISASSGDPIPGAKVTARELTVNTDSDGAFTIAVALPGSVDVFAFDYLPASFEVSPDDKMPEFSLHAIPVEELTVVSSRYVLFGESRAAQLTQDDIADLPHLADDVMRAVHRLPAVTADELSAKINLRGGTRDEIAVRLDGIDLIDPYHLKDLTGVFSIIDSNLVDSISVLPGGYPASYRDQTSGFVNINSLPPPAQAEHSIGVSFINSFINSRGSFNQQRGGWLVSVRRGYLDLLVEDQETDVFSPRYVDAFVKIEHMIGDRHIASLQVLGAWEDLDITDIDGNDPVEDIRIAGNSDTQFVWGRVQSSWNDRLRSDNVVWYSDVDRVRDSVLFAPSDTSSVVYDDRQIQVSGVRTDWQWSVSESWGLNFGGEFKEHDVAYDYSLMSNSNPLLYPGQAPINRRTVTSVNGNSYGAHVAVRHSVGKLDAELGWRWDAERYTGMDESYGSPRMSVQYVVSDRTRLSASWGDYNQFQRAESLHVEDGVEFFYPSARSEHRVIGFEHDWNESLLIRADAYQKVYSRVLPYYTNLFDPIEIAPEANPDRILVAADSAEAYGVELTTRYRSKGPFSVWASYTYSRVADEVDGRDIVRDWDQRHAINLVSKWRGEKWDFSVAASWHTGWPRTDVLLGTVDTPGGPQLGVIPGERNASNYDDYSRVDVRASRDVELERGVFTYYFEIYNLFNSKNICCVDTINLRPGPELSLDEEDWGGTLPSFGFVWTFR